MNGRKRVASVLVALGSLVASASPALARGTQITDGPGVHLVPPLVITRNLPKCARGHKVLKPEWLPMSCKLRRGQRLDVVLSHRTYLADQQATCDDMGGWLYRTPDGLWEVCVGVDY